MTLNRIDVSERLVGRKVGGDTGMVEIDIGFDPEVTDTGYQELVVPSAEASTGGAAEPASGLPLLGALPAAALATFVSRAEYRAVKPGARVFSEGDRADRVYLVASGELVVTYGDPPVTLAKLGPESFFGEMALLDDSPRSASVTAVTPSELLAVDREVVLDICARYPSVLTTLMQSLRSRLVSGLMGISPLLARLPEAERPRVVANFHYAEMTPGTAFIRQGQQAPGLFILLAGSAEITIDGRSVAEVTPGDVVGEMSSLTQGRAEATVTARTRLMALTISATDIRALMQKHPRLRESLVEIERRRHEERAARGGGLPDLKSLRWV
jgi:CRP-like cAMP-binding protein